MENIGNGAMELLSTCFTGNRAYGNGLVNVYGTELPTTMNNFGANNEVVYTVDLECEFVALVDGDDPTFQNLACADFDATVCGATTQPPSPVAAPTAQPTTAPTPAPVVAPAPVESPSMTGSKDMLTIKASEDAPSIMTGPDSAPSEPPNMKEPSQYRAQGPTLPLNERPSAFSPAMTPSMITPNMFSPAMFSPSIQMPVKSPTIEVPSSPFAFPLSLFCDGTDYDELVLTCHAENCPNCNHLPLPASTRTCQDLNNWFCSLFCCSDCSAVYNEAFECAEEVVEVDGCSQNCGISGGVAEDATARGKTIVWFCFSLSSHLCLMPCCISFQVSTRTSLSTRSSSALPATLSWKNAPSLSFIATSTV